MIGNDREWRGRLLRRKFAKYSPQTRWVTENRATISLNIKGMTLSGSLEVQAHSIDLDLEVPFLLRPFKSQAVMSGVAAEPGRCRGADPDLCRRYG